MEETKERLITYFTQHEKGISNTLKNDIPFQLQQVICNMSNPTIKTVYSKMVEAKKQHTLDSLDHFIATLPVNLQLSFQTEAFQNVNSFVAYHNFYDLTPIFSIYQQVYEDELTQPNIEAAIQKEIEKNQIQRNIQNETKELLTFHLEQNEAYLSSLLEISLLALFFNYDMHTKKAIYVRFETDWTFSKHTYMGEFFQSLVASNSSVSDSLVLQMNGYCIRMLLEKNRYINFPNAEKELKSRYNLKLTFLLRQQVGLFRKTLKNAKDDYILHCQNQPYATFMKALIDKYPFYKEWYHQNRIRHFFN